MKILFHIGMAKTGSSALQSALFHSSPYLLEHGILYPRNPDLPGARNHKIFATQLAPLDKLPRHMATLGDQAMANARFTAFHAYLRDLVRTSPPKLLLMSAETMFARIHPDHRGQLRSAFDALETVPAFVAYIRRPAERYVSGLQQHLRAAARVTPPRPAGYRENIMRYEAVFGSGCVTTHLFHRSALRDGDIVADFSGRYLEPFRVDVARLEQPGAVNVSLSAESMVVMQAFRQHFHANRENKQTPGSEALRELLRAADRELGAPRPRLRPEIADAIDYCLPDPLWLRDGYGITFPDFDYGRLERREFCALPERKLNLRQIVIVDAEMLRGILEVVSKSSWMNDRRRRWLQGIK